MATLKRIPIDKCEHRPFIDGKGALELGETASGDGRSGHRRAGLEMVRGRQADCRHRQL